MLTKIESTHAITVSLKDQQLFVVYHQNQTFVFNNVQLYNRFLSDQKTTYRRTFIGGGPRGNTIIYVLTQSDKDKKQNTAKKILGDNVSLLGKFYGEVYQPKENRFYIFTKLNRFKTYLKTGNQHGYFLDKHAGPNQEDVAYILEKSNGYQRSATITSTFNTIHGIYNKTNKPVR